MTEIDEAVASAETAGAKVANHEGQLERVAPAGSRNLVVSGWARDRTIRRPVQVAILVGGAVRTTVTANLPRPSGPANGFSATIVGPAQPADVCARTVADLPRAGVLLGCRQPGFPVRISVVTESGVPAEGEVASFFWVDPRGDIAKDLDTVPIVNGVARYVGPPIPHQLSWAITVHDPAASPLFRSGPLAELPGPASDVVAHRRVSIFRSTTDAGSRLNSGDSGIELLQRRLEQLPSPLRFESVQIRTDGAGHQVVVVRGRVRLAIVSIRFTYTLAVALRPATAPGHAAAVVACSVAAPGSFTAPGLSRFRDVLDRAILDGVEQAHDAAWKLIANIKMSLHDIGFPATFVSVTSIRVEGPKTSPTVIAGVHGGAISGPGGVVVTDS